MLSPLPRHSVWVQVFAHFPRRISLPRIGCQVGLRNVLLEACSAFIHITACTLAKSPSDPLHRRLQPLRCLHDCFDCFRLERKLPGGTLTHWKTPPYHGARRNRTVHSLNSEISLWMSAPDPCVQLRIATQSCHSFFGQLC